MLHVVEDQISEKLDGSSIFQDKSGKCLTEEQEILSRWTEYCSEPYNHESCGDKQFWTAVSSQKRSYNQSFVRKLGVQ